jgi:predicted nuclease of predicted toxin-antitoxin system
MRFLLDTHMPPRLVREFALLGHECLQVRTLLTPDSPDDAIAQAANELSAVMVSKDADFVDFHERGVLKVPLVWVRLGNVTSVAICADFRLRIPAICAAIEAGEQLVQVRA